MHRVSLYDADFYGWTQTQADLIRSGNIAGLDLDNILEEIETMGRSEKRGLKNRLAVLLTHLLKWQYQPGFQGKSWKLTIQEQRIQVRDIIQDSPSLRSGVAQTMASAWEQARIKAERETGISQAMFPQHCPWSFEQALNDAFWPDADDVRTDAQI